MGLPSVGNPSQFVLERLATAAGRDLCCLTVDVAPHALAEAIRGADVMGFTGLLLADSLGSRAFELVARDHSVTEVLGAVDLVCRYETQWVGSHSLMLAVQQWLQDLAEPPAQAVVFGSGLAARAAVCGLVAADCPQIHLVAPEALALELTPWCARLSEKSRVDFAPETVPELRDAPAIVVDATEDDTLPLEQLAEASQVVQLRSDLTTAPPALPAAISVTGAVDMLVRRYAIAFESLTAAPADRDLIRESLEEFFLI